MDYNNVRVGKGRNKYSFFDKFIFFLLSNYFILFPFYLWDSGLPQLSDIIIVILMITYSIRKKLKLRFPSKNKAFLIFGLLFIIYVTFSNLIWITILKEPGKMGIVPLFYIYNFFTNFFIIALYTEYNEKFLEVIYNSVIISVLLQVVILIISGGYTGGRMMLGFNNPNQLGYYTLTTTSIVMVISNKILIKRFWIVMVLLSNLMLVIASLSSTAIISYIGLLVIYILIGLRAKKVTRKKNKKDIRNMIVLIIVIVVIIATLDSTTNIIRNSAMGQGLRARVIRTESKIKNFIQERGYYRITEYPEYWILGAGEGKYYERFGSVYEFHSTLGNIQVSYGLIGTLLFANIMMQALKRDKYRYWYVLLFIMAYGLTHNGIRSSLLWVLLALMASNQNDNFKGLNMSNMNKV